MSFAVTGYRNNNTSSGGGSVGAGDILKNITVSANGNTGETLPANSLIKFVALKGDAGTVAFSIGSDVDPELLFPATDLVANVRETYGPAVLLPALFPIYVYGVTGNITITFVYQIVTL